MPRPHQDNNPEFNAKHPRKGGKFTKKGAGLPTQGAKGKIINGLGKDVTQLLRGGGGIAKSTDIRQNQKALAAKSKADIAAAKKAAHAKSSAAKKASKGRLTAAKKVAAARSRAAAQRERDMVRAVNGLAPNQRAAYRKANPKPPPGQAWGPGNKLISSGSAAALSRVSRGLPPAAKAAKKGAGKKHKAAPAKKVGVASKSKSTPTGLVIHPRRSRRR